ncbi:MAG: hypothetical protein LBK61_13735, partial [Spirochaetaceae bacterium]|nr:hypothetical protein [Spirochaetaceae bacterium]
MKTGFTAFAFFVTTVVLLASCAKPAAQGANEAQPNDPRIAVTAGASEFSSDGEWANAEAVRAAFTLDYRAQTPEAAQEDEEGRLDLRTSPASGGGNQVVGGGLRAISAYATKYFNTAAERARIEAIVAAQEATRTGTVVSAQAAGDLAVVDWGPQGLYSAANQHPSIYVIFNQPVTPLAALGVPSAKSPIVTITPEAKGAFRWYGTAFLAFEGDEPLQSQQTYTITVSPSTQSVYGNTITGDRVFTFQTETLSLASIVPGEQFKRENRRFYFSNRDVPPDAARLVTLEFNYPVRAADMEEFIAVSVSGEARPFRLSQSQGQNEERKLLCEITGDIGFEKTVSVTLKQGAKSKTVTRGTERDETKTFSTPSAFKADEFRRRSSYGRYRNLVDIEFSYSLDESSVTPAVIRTEPAMPITGDNIEVWGSTLRIYNLPVTYGDTFSLFVDRQIKDMYGRELGRQASNTITVPDEPPPEGHVAYLNRGDDVVMLESQFPPRYLFEYTNIESGHYTLATIGNPFSDSESAESKTFPLEKGTANAKYFADIDLKPFLNTASKGFVRFTSNIQLLPRYEEMWNDRWYDISKDETVIQVTDIGLTVRYGFNKAVVMAASLETGKPIEGMNVRLIAPYSAENAAAIDIAGVNAFASGVTDSRGLAIITMDAGVFRANTLVTTWRESFYIY